MGGRDRQVDDQLDVGMREELIDGEGLDAELIRAGFRALGEHVGDADELRRFEGGREVLAVDLGDNACADDADADWPGSSVAHENHP